MLVLHNVRKIPSNVMFWKPEIAGCLLMGTVPPKKKRGYARITHIYIYIYIYMICRFDKLGFVDGKKMIAMVDVFI